MADIFISYRRSDSEYFSGALLRALNARLSEHEIYMDYEDIVPGEKFAESIMNAVSACHAVIVVVGKEWLSVRDKTGRRLDNPDDWVRREIIAALHGEALVIPVTLEGVKMPMRSELPREIEEIADIQAISVSNSTWDADISRICELCSTKLGLKRITADSQKLVFENISSFEPQPTYRCNSCSAEFVGKVTLLDEDCPLCKSELLLQAEQTIDYPTRVEKALVKIELDEAKDLILDRLGQSIYRSVWWRRMLRDKIDLNIVYFPFYKFDCSANSFYKARRIEKTRSGDENEKSIWNLENEHYLRIEETYVPASDYQWWVKSIAPLDTNYYVSRNTSDAETDRRHFHLAVKRNTDESIKQFLRRAKEDISDSIKKSVGGDEQSISYLRTAYSQARLSVIEIPIYISCFKYRGDPTFVAINSVNMEIFDNGPESILKYLLTLLGWLVASILIFIGLSIALALYFIGVGMRA